MSKRDMRKQLAALSFSEKVRMLEKLRDRSLTIAAAGLRRRESLKFVDERKSNHQFCTCLGGNLADAGNSRLITVCSVAWNSPKNKSEPRETVVGMGRKRVSLWQFVGTN